MKAIAVCSGKGGAGKTVFSCALATMLVELKFRVVVVDADCSVAGLTYITRKMRDGADVAHREAQAVVEDSTTTFQDLIGDYEREFDLPSIAEDQLTIVPSRLNEFEAVAGDRAYPSLRQVVEQYPRFLQHLKAVGVDYVITDTRAGLDDVSAGVALTSDYAIVLMEQDRVSWRSSTAFVANVLALKREMKLETSVTADDFYYVPNKVTPAFARSLQALDNELPGNVLGGIPLDVNFFNRYFRDIFRYGPQGRSWRRTAFYRHVARSLSRIEPSLPTVSYLLSQEILDTVSLVLFSLSPRVTVFIVTLLVYFVLTMYMILRFL